MTQPLIVRHADGDQRVQADGRTMSIHQWRGSGPPAMHVHHEDDEAWHVLRGELRFRFGERVETAAAGTTVFVPAGVAHTYEALEGADYLVILTPRLRSLIAELQSSAAAEHPRIYREHASELLE